MKTSTIISKKSIKAHLLILLLSVMGMMNVKAQTYICDPSFEYGRGRNGYMINYGQSGTLRYVYGFILEENSFAPAITSVVGVKFNSPQNLARRISLKPS